MRPNVDDLVRRSNLLPDEGGLDQLFSTDLERLLLDDVRDRKDGRMAKTRGAVQPDGGSTIVDLHGDAVGTAGSPRRGAMVAMAAGFAVIVGVLGFALLTNEGTDAAAPLDVANAYIDARNAYDSDAVLALLADEPGQIVETVFGGFTGPSDYPSMMEWQEIIGWQFDVQGCREPQPGVIVCDYLVDLDLSRAIDAAPEEGVLRITVEDGEIQSIANNYVPDAALDNWYYSFLDWVEETHPQDAPGMSRDSDGTPRFDPQSLERWARLVPEYLASVEG